MLPLRLMLAVFLLAALGYVAIGWAAFEMPASPELAAACGFTTADLNSAGQLDYAPTQAWLLSFMRKQEYFNAICIGLAGAFVAFVLARASRLGAGLASGAAVGGGALALGALCLGCLAPMLSVVGLGVASSALLGVPKWMMALNTLLLTAWGTLYLSRTLNACPVLPPRSSAPVNNNKRTQ
jgi:hypothetical protein